MDCAGRNARVVNPGRCVLGRIASRTPGAWFLARRVSRVRPCVALVVADCRFFRPCHGDPEDDCVMLFWHESVVYVCVVTLLPVLDAQRTENGGG